MTEPDTDVEMTTAELADLGTRLLACGFFKECGQEAECEYGEFEMECL